MVTCRSPKPFLRVRVLLPLPKNSIIVRWCCFFISKDSNPERAFFVKKKLPVASFLEKWCADGYCTLACGRQAVKMRSICVLLPLPKNSIIVRWCCFFISKDSNPERAFFVKKKLPVASFLEKWCADGYCTLACVRSSSSQDAQHLCPSTPAKKQYHR